jgi:hypothetical protein
MSLDSDGTRRRNEFFTDTKEIHCIAKAGIGRDGVTVESFIRSVQLFDFDSGRYETIDAILAYAEFKADRAQQSTLIDLGLTPRDPRDPNKEPEDTPPFFPGRYQCDILIDGELEGSAIFNIGFPPCPPAIIPPGARCFGFYKENDVCPQYGASAQQEPKCTCTLAGWQC